VGFFIADNAEEAQQMGNLKTYKNVPFGFSIISKNKIKFSKGYPFSIFGEYYEASAGLTSMGSPQIEYTLGNGEGNIRRNDPDTYILRTIRWDLLKTDIMHATCEKL
jgi:hypothetical protein